MSDLDCKKPKLCETPPPPDPIPCSPAFDLCVGDRTLKWDGFCVTVERPRITPDGTYTAVTVVDGCIVGYGYADEATYTPPYCNPNPNSCQDGGNAGGAGNTGISISPDPTNIIRINGGLYARSYVRGGAGITVTGTGTVGDPYIVSASGATTAGGTSVVVARNGLEAETNNGVTLIGIEPSGVTAGTYDVNTEFTVDRFGRITATKDRDQPIVTAGAGLTATNDGDSIEISHPVQNVDDTAVFGGYTVRINRTGHITYTERGITLSAGTYNIGAYDVTVNGYGSITNLTQRSDVMPSDGTFETADGKTISYDVTGRLTGIQGGGAGGNAGGGNAGGAAPSAIRDMYRVIPGGLLDTVVETYGTPADINGTYGGGYGMQLPSYVTSASQISISNAKSWNIDLATRRLTIVPIAENRAFTITFRA